MLAGIAFSASTGRAERLDLAFGKGAFRANEVFDSASSPPSRYLIEMGRRLLAAVPSADILIIGNPLLPLTSERLAGWIKNIAAVPSIITDRARFPAAYVLPRRLFEEDERFLLLLSTVDARADAQLLNALTGQDVPRQKLAALDISHFPVSTATGWFQGTERQKMLKLLCVRALETIANNPGWRKLSFAAYQPYHAGSVLFFDLASQAVSRSFFDKQIICTSYRDIWQACPSRQQPLWLRLPWLPRDNSVGELQYLVSALDRLGDETLAENFVVFMRYSRVYSAPPFHLIDQLRFALGDSMQSVGETIHGTLPPPSSRCALPLHPLRILFHLTGGWKLKTYPKRAAAGLIKTLRAMGCEVTVIDGPDLEGAGARSITADSTSLLREAASNHHLFIGVDSFPHHFVRHVLHWPTIGLFANTKPCNSDARPAPDYLALAGSLPCNPCGGQDSCPVFGRNECPNFSTPQQILAAIADMANAVYGFTF